MCRIGAPRVRSVPSGGACISSRIDPRTARRTRRNDDQRFHEADSRHRGQHSRIVVVALVDYVSSMCVSRNRRVLSELNRTPPPVVAGHPASRRFPPGSAFARSAQYRSVCQCRRRRRSAAGVSRSLTNSIRPGQPTANRLFAAIGVL
jgi:hypothetical protein